LSTLLRNTKIVATVGPACDDEPTLLRLYERGVDVARVNLSHGTDAAHREMIAMVRKTGSRVSPERPLALMLDTRGPELRLKGLEEPIRLEAGQRLAMAGLEDAPKAAPEGVPTVRTSVPHLVHHVPEDARVLIDDGRVVLHVVEVLAGWVIAVTENPATIEPGKGIAFPGIALDLPFLSDEDLRDLELAAEVGADWVALSFVQQATDVLQARDYLGDNPPALVAKIETLMGYRNLDAILQVADGVMIGRGDLGVDCPPEEIPLMQKDIIRRCNGAGVPVITATQMLESMIESPIATRAEASDVANAILDGTDAVMLSAETAIGKYPAEAVSTMTRIIVRTESGWGSARKRSEPDGESVSVTDAVARSAVWIAAKVAADAILTPTQSGHTGIMVSRHRPEVPVIAVTSARAVWQRLALVWGVHPLLKEGEGDVVEDAGDVAMAAGCVAPGARVVITSGQPQGVPGTTNALQVRTLGKILVRGAGVGRTSARGRAAIRTGETTFNPEFCAGDVMVIDNWDAGLGDFVKDAAAIIAEEPGLSSPAALAGLGRGIPVLVGVKAATATIEPGSFVTVDARRGLVYALRLPGNERNGAGVDSARNE